LELEDAPAALLAFGERGPALLLELLCERAGEALGLALPPEGGDGDGDRRAEPEHQEHEQHLRDEPPALGVRQTRRACLGRGGAATMDASRIRAHMRFASAST